MCISVQVKGREKGKEQGKGDGFDEVRSETPGKREVERASNIYKVEIKG